MIRSIRINFPKNLTTTSALKFGEDLRSLPLVEHYELDFTESNWIEPFSALIASSEITRFKYRVNTPIKVLNHQHMSYAAHIGFFQSFGLVFGNSPGGVAGSMAYHPIQILTSESIQSEANSLDLPVGEIMERHADRLAKVLCQADSGNVHDTLQYSMREIMRNVVEHSGADRIAFCAQYWPTKERVEVGVMDWGVGIKRGLQQNPKLKPESDGDAIKLALMPGISGKAGSANQRLTDSRWRNSGYGLYMTSRLCRSGGTFLLASGNSGVMLSGQDMAPMNWGLEGTSIRMQMNVSNLPKLKGELDRFSAEAHNFRQKSRGVEYLDPSAVSKALLKDLI